MSKAVTLVWVDPSTRVDGSPLLPNQIEGIHVFMSADLGANFVELGSVAPGIQTFTQTDLPDGTYKFRVIVVDKQVPAKSSPPTELDVAVVTILADPSPVSGLSASVN